MSNLISIWDHAPKEYLWAYMMSNEKQQWCLCVNEPHISNTGRGWIDWGKSVRVFPASHYREFQGCTDWKASKIARKPKKIAPSIVYDEDTDILEIAVRETDEYYAIWKSQALTVFRDKKYDQIVGFVVNDAKELMKNGDTNGRIFRE